MHSIIVLTGSLGSGKTTVGKLMASRLSNGAHIESDVFYTFFSHPIAPHLPEADKQNKAAIAAACQAAKALYQRGYCVVLEGIFGPWALPLISAELATHTADVRYVILRTTLDEAIRRVRGRSGMSLDEVVATMHPQFEQLGEWEGNALETSCLAPTTVVDQLMDLLPNGLFRLSSSGVLHAGGVQPFHREDVTRQAGRRLSCQTLDLMTRAREPKRVSPFSILEARPFLASLNSAILGALQVRDLVEDMHKLNVHEQTVICVDTFLKESEADGVSHFFYYESAALYDKVLLGLEAIGAYGTRIGLSRYVDRVFAGEVPRSVSARQATIDSLDDAQADQAERMVGNVSDATSLLATWAKTHREHFRLE